MGISKEILQRKITQEQRLYDEWYRREMAAMWNDDGKGNHIPADEMMKKYKFRIELLNELIKECPQQQLNDKRR